jgi:hypothetical protein
MIKVQDLYNRKFASCRPLDNTIHHQTARMHKLDHKDPLSLISNTPLCMLPSLLSINFNKFDKFLIGGFAQKRVIKDELSMIYLDEVRRNSKIENQNPHEKQVPPLVVGRLAPVEAR